MHNQLICRFPTLFVLAVFAMALFAAPASAMVLPDPFGKNALPGKAEKGLAPGEARYIVVFEDSVAHPGILAHEQAGETEGKVGFVYRTAIEGYSVVMPKSEVAELESDPAVKHVEPDLKMRAFSQATPTGISRIEAPLNETLQIDSSDNGRVSADVAVLDTGVDPTHPDLDVFRRTNCMPRPIYTAECIERAGIDRQGHGTHVAGTIGALDNGIGVTGVAPGARIWAVRVLGDEGFSAGSSVLAGIDWVTAHASEIEVANMSLGGAGTSVAINEAIKASVEAGVLYAVAAGNSNKDAKGFSPANSPDVITVSALADYNGKAGGKATATCNNYGADDTLASFSNFGSAVEVAAPGVCIESTLPTTESEIGKELKTTEYGTISGTSMATPHVAGAAAILASKDNPEDLEDVEALRETIEAEGSSAWEDTSKDGIKEPLLNVPDEEAFAAVDQVAATKPSTHVSASAETLHGEVDPGGIETSYQFEYGTTTAYGSKAPASPKSAGSGSKYTPVSTTVEGLSGQTLYHYRLVATNVKGAFHGPDRTFATTPPTLETKAVSEVEANHATFNATVNPEGLETYYQFEFGPTDAYGDSTPITSATTLTGAKGIEIDRIVGGFDAEKTYHYRVVAESVAGKVYGKDQTFTTGPSQWKLQETLNPDVSPYERAGPRLMGVDCASSTFCMSIGTSWTDAFWLEHPISQHWSNGEWQNAPIPDRRKAELLDWLRDVSCVSSAWCMAVGVSWDEPAEEMGPLVASWGGKEWTLDAKTYEAFLGTRLADVSCVSSAFCLAVGSRSVSGFSVPVALQWNGSSWSETSLPSEASSSLDSISCTSAKSCVAVGRYLDGSLHGGGLVTHWNGTGWTDDTSSFEGGESLVSVSCSGQDQASTRCMATSYAEVARFDGKAWTVEEALQPPGSRYTTVTDVTCISESACTSVGYYRPDTDRLAPFSASWNGSEWTVESVADPSEQVTSVGSGFDAVSCTAPQQCTAVGFHFLYDGWRTVAERISSGIEWSFAFGKPGSGNGQFGEVQGIEVDAGGNVWVADPYNARIQKFNAKGEYQSQFSGPLGNELHWPHGLAIDSSSNLWVADSDRIVKFNSKGEFLSEFGKEGSGNGQFNWAHDIALDSSGNLWVADTGNQRIQKFNAKGEYLSQFGKEGSGNGQFVQPSGIAIDASGNVWATDTDNHRIQKFNSKGEYLAQFGTKGSGNGQFVYPRDIEIDSGGNVWITDTGNARIQEFNLKGEYLNQFGTKGEGEGQFREPTVLAFGPSGGLWVADNYKLEVQKWDVVQPTATTEAVTEVSDKGVTLNATVNPNGFETAYRFEYGTTTAYGTSVPIPDEAIGSGTSGVKASKAITGLLASTTYHYRVVATNAQGSSVGKDATFTTKPDPRFAFDFGSPGMGNGQFTEIHGIEVDSSGNVWVADYGRIQKFNSSGVYQSQFDGEAASEWLSSPHGIEVDSSGNLWIADTINHRIAKFSSKGEFLAKFGTEGEGNGQLIWPYDVAVDSSGNLWVADTANQRIQKFNAKGEFLAKYGSFGTGNGQFEEPAGIAIDASGNVWVLDANAARIQKFNSQGEYLSQFGSKGSGNGQFGYPQGIEIDSSGNIWVTDGTRVQKFNAKGEYLSQFGVKGEDTGQLREATAIAAGSSGSIWIADNYKLEVQKWVP